MEDAGPVSDPFNLRGSSTLLELQPLRDRRDAGNAAAPPRFYIDPERGTIAPEAAGGRKENTLEARRRLRRQQLRQWAAVERCSWWLAAVAVLSLVLLVVRIVAALRHIAASC